MTQVSYRILVKFPIDLDLWAKSLQILHAQTLPYIFTHSSSMH